MDMTDLDFQRIARQGFPEFVYGEFKTVDQLQTILTQFQDRGQSCFITRLGEDKGLILEQKFPKGNYTSIARTFQLGPSCDQTIAGLVTIVAAGTSDAAIASEVKQVLDFLGIASSMLIDKGVAGLHRTLGALPEIQRADVVICIAGFEGALASVLSGLIHQPIIGVPTSIGYGVAKDGLVALNAMLASCANGLTVVNIDNGFGAALAAYRIINQRMKEIHDHS